MKTRPVDVLLIDDDPDDVFLIGHAFEHVAPELHLMAVNDADEAKRLLERCDEEGTLPRVILLDLKLPRTDGLQLLRQLRHDETTAEVAVFMLSSSSEPAEVAAAYARGANGYLVKEADMAALDRLVGGIAEYAAMQPAPKAHPATDQTPEPVRSA